jgi:hypothetical protein
VGVKFVLNSELEVAFIGDVRLPAGSRYLGSSLLPNSYVVARYDIQRGGELLLALRPLGESRAPEGQLVAVASGIEVTLDGRTLIATDCAENGKSDLGLIAIVSAAGDRPRKAMEAWRFNPIEAVFDESPAGEIACDIGP